MGTTVTNKKLFQVEIMRRLNSGYVRYHRVQNLLSSSSFKELKIGLYKIIIVPVILYGCRTWSLTLREEYSLRSRL
jgi:hypothetical protein